MKNDIDDILNSMFRGGTLQTRGKKDQKEANQNQSHQPLVIDLLIAGIYHLA